MECYCFLHNLTDLGNDGYTAWQNRITCPTNNACQHPITEFKGYRLAFGQAIQYVPKSPKDIERLHKMGRKTLDGIFVGYKQKSGGNWTGDYYVVD